MVELGRPTGTGTPAGAQALEAGLEETAVDQAVEVVRGQRAADSDRARRLVSADRAGLADHESVQAPSNVVAEAGDHRDLLVEVLRSFHTQSVKQTAVDKMTVRPEGGVTMLGGWAVVPLPPM